MSIFPKKKDKLDYIPKKTLKYIVIGLIFLGIGSLCLTFLKNSFSQGIFSSIASTINEILRHLLNIFIILLLCVPVLLFSKILYNKSKIIAGLILSIFISFLFTIVCAFYIFGIEYFSVFTVIGTSILEFLKSIDNLSPFILVLPFLIIFYLIKLRIPTHYELSNLSIKNHILVIDDGKKKNFKALAILQIQNIPKNIVVKEERTRKKNIEKLMIPGNLQYLHYHLTSLAKIIPNISFEIRVVKNDIQLRLIITMSGVEINEVINEVEVLKEIVVTAFQTTFPGLKFEILRGNQLKNAWGDIFGGWGSYKFKFVDKNKVYIDKIVEKTYLSILKFEDNPDFKIINRKSQIDALIRGLIGSQFDLNYIISARPMEIYDFEKQKHLIKKRADKVGAGSWSKRTSGNFEFGMIYPLKNKIEEEEIREDLLKIRHAEITGIWDVSGYIVIRSNHKDKLDVDIQKIISLISTIFGIELNILESNKLQRSFSKISMRSFLHDPITLTSEQLAIFFHLPENPIPSLSRIDIPEFEIPPEKRTSGGISVGKILLYDQEMYPLRLTIEDFRLNTFICGLIGMGKSRLAMNILKQLTEKHQNINWICLDWKGEYGYLINEIKSHEIVVLIPGSDIAPIKLNMFDPQNSNSDEHARKLFAIIREVFKSEFNRQSDLSSQMESVCKEVIRYVVKNPKLRNLDAFIQELKNYARNNMAKNRTIMMTVTALINRFDKFRHGVLKDVLDVKKSNINFDNLMEKKVIIDLNHLLTAGGAKEDVRLLLNLILKYIIDKALGRGITDTLKHIVVIEDSQFLIPSVLREVPETSLVEDIPLLLRGVGESLITIATRPEISSDIIANSGVKITFKSPYDSQKIARYQNLSESQERYLRIMQKREAIVTLPNFQFPFRIFTDYFEYQKVEDQDIFTRNLISSRIYQPNSQSTLEREDIVHFTGVPMDIATNTNQFSINRDIIENKEECTNKFGYNLIEDESNINISKKNQKKQKSIIKSKITFSEIKKILKYGPQNKKTLSEKLSIPKSELDMKLEFLFEKGQILSCIAPIFNKKTKQKLYLLADHKDWVEKEIRTRLENEFLENGKIGKLSDEDTFDYIWYGNNTFLKLFYSSENVLNLNKISKLLFNWFEEAIERGSFELIIIVPFFDWGTNLRSWLKSFNSDQILIFSYNIDDWNKLNEYLAKGINPDWEFNTIQKSKNVNNLGNFFSFSEDNSNVVTEKHKFQSNLNFLVNFQDKNAHKKDIQKKMDQRNTE